MKTSKWIALGLLAALIVLAVVVAGLVDPAALLDPRDLRSAVRGHGAFAPVLFVLVMALARMFFVPGLPIVIAGGFIFGWFGGFGLSLLGEMLGATGAFLFARHLGRDWINRRFIKHRDKLSEYDQKLKEHGIVAVISLRLFNVLPFTPFDIALGLTSVRVKHYVAGTLIGVTPGTFIASYLGEAIYEWQTVRIIAGVALLLVLASLPLVYKWWTARKGKGE